MAENKINEQEIKEQVESEIQLAREFTRQIGFDEVQSGEWFIKLLQQVIHTYHKNGRAEYFQQKYPGLPADEIAAVLISVTGRYAAIAGALAGVAISADQITFMASAGLTGALFVGALGAEMVYLARLQLRLVLDLSIVYDLQLDPDDPEDILMIFGYALGVTPTEFIGKGIQIAASTVTKTTVQQVLKKETLKAVQDFARRLGFKILQRTVIKYLVPGVSAAVGSTYNYTSTVSVGNIAKAHFRAHGKVSEELRTLISRQNVYDLIYPAAILYIARVDGEVTPIEHDLYRAILSRMTFEEHQQQVFQQLIKHESHLLDGIAKLKDSAAAETMMELLSLMAVYDGKLVQTETEFLKKAATALNFDLDIEELENRANAYRVNYSDPQWRKVVEKTGSSLGLARDTGLQLLQRSAEKAKNGMLSLFKKTTDNSQESAT